MEYRNLIDLFCCQASRFGPRPAIRYRRHGVYTDLSWDSYLEQSRACGAALVDAGVSVGDRVGVLSENRVEWLIADMAILSVGAVNVPIHAPLSSTQIRYQLEHANVRWLFVSGQEQLKKVERFRESLPELCGIVSFDRCAEHSWQGLLQRGRRVIEKHGGELERRRRLVDRQSLATIMYTSGTTGRPKGVMLTHGNLLSNAEAVDSVFVRDCDFCVLAWLPLSHIYARLCDHYSNMVAGLTLWLAESAETVVRDLAEARPHHMAGVPRFYEKVLQGVVSEDAGKTAERLRSLFGPRMIWMNSGGAALPLSVGEAYLASGIPALQGYGLTETSPVISFNRPEGYKLESVGRPVPGVEVRIADDGEILTRGPHVMAGYWRDPEATAAAMEEGWFRTGDLGRLDDEGFLTITGRKKELLVLSNSKKVVPTYIEGLLVSDSCVDQAVVYGEGHSFLTALIVPHWDNVRVALREAGQDFGDMSAETLAQEAAVYDLLEGRVQAALESVAPWEVIRRFVILPRPFSVDAEELTVSMKLRRRAIFEKYAKRLESMYEGD